MSLVYVDFVRREDLDNKSSFRDLEKEFLKKYKDREIIGFFEYKPYPLELVPVTLSIVDDKLTKYTPAPLVNDKKYVIITDKSKFTNETFKKTFENKTREAFQINMKRTENKDKYTFLKKNNLKADEYILPNPFGINLFEGTSGNYVEKQTRTIKLGSKPQVTTETEPEGASAIKPEAILGSTHVENPPEKFLNNLDIKKSVASSATNLVANPQGVKPFTFSDSMPSISMIFATSKAADEVKSGNDTQNQNPNKNTTQTNGPNPSASSNIKPTEITPVATTDVKPGETILGYFKISEKDVPQKIKEFNRYDGKASSIQEMYNKTKQILGETDLDNFYSIRDHIFKKIHETFGLEHSVNTFKRLIRDAIKVRKEQQGVNLNLKLDNFESLLPIDLLINQDAFLEDVRNIVSDPTLEKKNIYKSLEDYLDPYYVVVYEENLDIIRNKATLMFPELKTSNEIETFYNKFSRDLMQLYEDENDSSKKLISMFTHVNGVFVKQVFNIFEQLKYKTEQKFEETFKMSAEKAQELITEIEISLDLPLQTCSKLMPFEKILFNKEKVGDECFEYEIFLLSLLDETAIIDSTNRENIYTLLKQKFTSQVSAEKKSTESSSPLPSGEIYLETQQMALCGRHAINHLLQTKFLDDKKMQEFCGDPDKNEHGSIDEDINRTLKSGGDDKVDEELKNYFHCESSRGDNLNIDAVQRILIMSGYRVKNMGAILKKEKFSKELQKQMLIGIIVNTGGHYVAIVKFIPGKQKYTWIDSMKTHSLTEFEDDEKMLSFLQARNFSNFLFVYGTAKSAKTPTFNLLNLTEYNKKYEALEAIQDSLPGVLAESRRLFGKNMNYEKDLETLLKHSVLSDSDLRNLIWNALLINNKFESDLIDSIIDSDESLRLEPNNIVASELEGFLKINNYFEFLEKIQKSKQENKKFEPFMKCIQLYSKDISTVFSKLSKHGLRSIYQFCYECNVNRDPDFWCNPYTLIEEDTSAIKKHFSENFDNFKKFIETPILPENPSLALQRFKKLVDLNKANPNKLKENVYINPVTREVRKYEITFDNCFSMLSQFAFDQAKKNNNFEQLFESAAAENKKTSGGKKTHKLRIKLNKKSLRHKTRNTINRL
jgi:hypothetical protein